MKSPTRWMIAIILFAVAAAAVATLALVAAGPALATEAAAAPVDPSVLRWGFIAAALVYVGIVAAFESLIGVLQPSAGATLVITTLDEAGAAHDRVVSRLESDGKLYVAANHWPRAWYRRALANPEVQATIDGQKRNYRAVPVTGAEHERVEGEHPAPLAFRILTGFPPRYFVRLDLR